MVAMTIEMVRVGLQWAQRARAPRESPNSASSSNSTLGRVQQAARRRRQPLPASVSHESSVMLHLSALYGMRLLVGHCRALKERVQANPRSGEASVVLCAPILTCFGASHEV